MFRNYGLAPLRNQPFRRYWAALTGSATGDGVLSVALPLTAIVLGADAAKIGWLTALSSLPSILFAIPAGGFMARSRHPVVAMILADLVRFGATITIPIAALLGELSLPILDATGFVISTASVFFSVADAFVFPSLLTKDQIVAGQSLTYGARTVASMAGSAIAGLLVPLLSAPITTAVDSASYLWSASSLARIGRVSFPHSARGSSRLLSGGLRFILNTSTLRRALGLTTTSNFFGLMFQSLSALYLTRTLGLPVYVVGISLGAEAAGAFGGSVVASAVARALDLQRGLLVGSLLSAAPMTAIAIAAGSKAILLLVISAAFLLSGIGRALQDINVAAIFASTVPTSLRAQVRGAYQMVSYGARPVGAVLGGLIGQQLGVHLAICAAAMGGLLAFPWALRPRKTK
ncbi:MFS transporter [Actinoplanes sp. NPDC051343]|uniref:MFS transporter n=1 Tax=Actinoplanes sp. NPDC051343 TaxID=3363906 RepID=UPI0037A89341